MFQLRPAIGQAGAPGLSSLSTNRYRIISAWRYPGVSPKRNPIPAEILREIEEESTFEEVEEVYL